MKIEITEEMILDLKHCIERTTHMWKQEVDLWPFTLYNIIEQYEKPDHTKCGICGQLYKPDQLIEHFQNIHPWEFDEALKIARGELIKIVDKEYRHGTSSIKNPIGVLLNNKQCTCKGFYKPVDCSVHGVSK